MEKSEIILTTLDNWTDVAVEMSDAVLAFTLKPHREAVTDQNSHYYHGPIDAIQALRDRGYSYAEELIRLAVSALRTQSYAA